MPSPMYHSIIEYTIDSTSVHTHDSVREHFDVLVRVFDHGFGCKCLLQVKSNQVNLYLFSANSQQELCHDT